MPNLIQRVDIIVVGGGIVGATVAQLLANQGLDIALFEQNPPNSFPKENVSFSRVSALNLASKNIFEELGVWSSLEKSNFCAFEHMKVFDAYATGQIFFKAQEIGCKELGFIVDNDALVKILWQKLESSPYISLIKEAILLDMHMDSSIATLHYEAQGLHKEIQASLVIGADGSQSWVREQSGISTIQKDYHQTAIVAQINTQKAHEKTAWQWFLPSGPLAFLPLSHSHEVSIVWSLPSSDAQILLNQDKTHFKKHFKKHLEWASNGMLGKIKKIGAYQSFPLKKQTTEHYLALRVVLIGDAAHTIHPLAGQGVNLGLMDAKCLVKEILNIRNKKQDFNSCQKLRRFERQAKARNERMALLTDQLNQIFSSRSTGTILMRSLGLNICHHSFIKFFFMRKAIGVQ